MPQSAKLLGEPRFLRFRLWGEVGSGLYRFVELRTQTDSMPSNVSR